MKKVFVIAFIACAFALSFTSCKKECMCTDAVTGNSTSIQTDNKYKNCQAIEDLLNEASRGLAEYSCK